MKKATEILVAIWRLLVTVIIAIMAWMIGSLTDIVYAETLYVTVNEGSTLNGRAEADKRSEVAAHFDCGEELEVVSYGDGWVEVKGSEYGTCWVCDRYVSSCPDSLKMVRIVSNGRVALRDKPDGKRIGWLKDGATVTVDGVLEGYYRTEKGYFSCDYAVACDDDE